MELEDFAKLCTSHNFTERLKEIKQKLAELKTELKLENYDEKRVEAELLKEDDERCAAAINVENGKELFKYLVTNEPAEKPDGKTIPYWQYLWNKVPAEKWISEPKPESVLAALTKIKSIPQLSSAPKNAAEDKDSKADLSPVSILLNQKNSEGKTLLEVAINSSMFSEQQLAQLAIEIIPELDAATLIKHFFEEKNPIFPKILDNPQIVTALLKKIFANGQNDDISKVEVGQADAKAMPTKNKSLINKIFSFSTKIDSAFCVHFFQYSEKDQIELLKYCPESFWQELTDLVKNPPIHVTVDKPLIYLANNDDLYQVVLPKITNKQTKEKLNELCKQKWQQLLPLYTGRDQKQPDDRYTQAVSLIAKIASVDEKPDINSLLQDKQFFMGAALEVSDENLLKIIPFCTADFLKNLLIENGISTHTAVKLWNKPKSFLAILEKVDNDIVQKLVFSGINKPLLEKQEDGFRYHAISQFPDQQLVDFLQLISKKDKEFINQLQDVLKLLWLKIWCKPESTLFLVEYFKNNARLIAEFLNCKDAKGNTLLHYAAEHYSQDQLQRLVCLYNTDQIDQSLLTCNLLKQTPLHAAADAGKTQNAVILMQSANRMVVTKAMSLLDTTQQTAYHYLAQKGETEGQPFTRADALKFAVEMDEDLAMQALLPSKAAASSDEKVGNMAYKDSVLFIPLLKNSLDLSLAVLQTIKAKDLNINKNNADIFLNYLAHFKFKSYPSLPNIFLILLNRFLPIITDDELKSVIKIAMANNDQEFIAALKVVGPARLKVIFSDQKMWIELIKKQSLASCGYLLSILQKDSSELDGIKSYLLSEQQKDVQLDPIVLKRIELFAALCEHLKNDVVSAHFENLDSKSQFTDQHDAKHQSSSASENILNAVLVFMRKKQKALAEEIGILRFADRIAQIGEESMRNLQLSETINNELISAIDALTKPNTSRWCSLPARKESGTSPLHPSLLVDPFDEDHDKLIRVLDLRSNIVNARAGDSKDETERLQAVLHKFTEVHGVFPLLNTVTQDDVTFLENLRVPVAPTEVRSPTSDQKYVENTQILLSTVDHNEVFICYAKARSVLAANKAQTDQKYIQRRSDDIEPAKKRRAELQQLGWNNISLQMGALVRLFKSSIAADEKDAERQRLHLEEFAQVKRNCESQDYESQDNAIKWKEQINNWNQQLISYVISGFRVDPNSIYDQALVNLSVELDKISGQPCYLSNRFKLIAATQQFVNEYPTLKKKGFGTKETHLGDLQKLHILVSHKLLVIESYDQKALAPFSQLPHYEIALLALYKQISTIFEEALKAQKVEYTKPVDKNTQLQIITPTESVQAKGYAYLSYLQQFLGMLHTEINLLRIKLQKLNEAVIQKQGSVDQVPKAIPLVHSASRSSSRRGSTSSVASDDKDVNVITSLGTDPQGEAKLTLSVMAAVKSGFLASVPPKVPVQQMRPQPQPQAESPTPAASSGAPPLYALII